MIIVRISLDRRHYDAPAVPGGCLVGLVPPNAGCVIVSHYNDFLSLSVCVAQMADNLRQIIRAVRNNARPTGDLVDCRSRGVSLGHKYRPRRDLAQRPEQAFVVPPRW
jgi:hypothetical protein